MQEREDKEVLVEEKQVKEEKGGGGKLAAESCKSAIGRRQGRVGGGEACGRGAGGGVNAG